MRIDAWTHPAWLSNTYLVSARDGGAAVVIDSGGPVDPLLEEARRRRLRITHVLNTHRHHDHTAENARLRRETGALIAAHRLDAPFIDACDEALEDGQVVRAGDLAIEVLHIPGHTAGQAAFLVDGSACFTGDTLFRGSIGGTTAAGHTTFADLRDSLLRLVRLPADTRILPGHAAPTTVAGERERNPFVRVLEGKDAAGTGSAIYDGRAVRLLVWARDYDGGFKAWIRLPDGTDLTVPGSRVRLQEGGAPER